MSSDPPKKPKKPALRAAASDEEQARAIIVAGLGELAITQEVELIMHRRPRSIRKIIKACEGLHFRGVAAEWPIVLRHAVLALVEACGRTGHRPTLRRILVARKRLSVEGYHRLLLERGDPRVYDGGRMLTPAELVPWAFLTVDSGPDDADDYPEPPHAEP